MTAWNTKKSGKHKFAFAWNLLGGAPTQGHERSRKEIPLHGAAHIGTRLQTLGSNLRLSLRDSLLSRHPLPRLELSAWTRALLPTRYFVTFTSGLSFWKAAMAVSVRLEQPMISNVLSDLKESDFGGLADYGKMTGKVIWSDALQEGYMTLTNLPVNDPAVKQYQLWIVDPKRDEKPVDGGVFDIPATGTVVVPIRNPVAVSDPKAFVITMEQPGGVVVSKQQVVVAIAKAS